MKRLGRIPESPASLAVFNHAILYVPKHKLFLDGTNGHSDQPALSTVTSSYRWTDANGVTHYGDRAPDKTQHVRSGNLRIIPVRAEAGAMVRLRVEGDPSSYQAWADNTLAGPIEVMLRFDHADNVAGDPILPARAAPPAGCMPLLELEAVSRDFDVSRPWLNRVIEHALDTRSIGAHEAPRMRRRTSAARPHWRSRSNRGMRQSSRRSDARIPNPQGASIARTSAAGCAS